MKLRIWNKSKKHTITSVLISNYALIMLISTLIALIIFSVITKKEVEYRQRVSDTHMINTFGNLIEVQLSENEYIVSNILTDNNLITILKQHGKVKQAKMGEFLLQKIAERSSIQSIHILDNDGVLYSEYKYPATSMVEEEFIHQFDFDLVKKEENSIYWSFGYNKFEKSQEDTLYVIRTIRSKRDFHQMGYLIVYFDPLLWKDSLDSYASLMEFAIAITDSNDHSIYFPTDTKLQMNKEELMQKGISMKIDRLDAVLYGKYYGKDLNSNIIFAMIFFLLVNIFFILISSVIIRAKVTEPLQNIAESARNIKQIDDLSIRFEQKDNYVEIEDIENALNEMMEQISGLVCEVKEKNKIENQLRLSVLNHQVKPHFLYNTLNTIGILISVEQKETASVLLKSLARYYRACLSKGNDVITIASELEIVKEYVTIALIRNPNIAKINYQIDEELSQALIPKMTIQTLIENCMKYGVKEMGKPVEIIIKISKLNSTTYQVSVYDNGVGIQDETKQMILQGKNASADSGFGLKAVTARIRLAFDLEEQAKVMEINSVVGEYAEIKLQIPLRN